MNTLLERTWFIPSTYKENQQQASWDDALGENFDLLSNIGNVNWTDVKQGPYIFFSRSPITFGHSLLVIPKPAKAEFVNEVEYFHWASLAIQISLRTFIKAFGELEIHNLPEFDPISKFTRTDGHYIKTLILKANANEDVDHEYKVHLIPFFGSHDKDCHRNFLKSFPNSNLNTRKGGLLSWLGLQEKEVDRREVILVKGGQLEDKQMQSSFIHLANTFRKINQGRNRK